MALLLFGEVMRVGVATVIAIKKKTLTIHFDGSLAVLVVYTLVSKTV